MQSKKVQVGDFIIWSLSDGYLDIDQRFFKGIEPNVLRNTLSHGHVQCVSDLVVRMQVNGFLIKTDDQLILVDTGSGTECGVTAGFLIDSLKGIGFSPEQISLVLITHLHPDHIGRLLTQEGRLTFPNATVCVSAIDANYFRDSAQEARANKDNHPYFALAKKMLAPYESSGKLRLIYAGDSVAFGVTAIEAYGHTPGHMAFLFCLKNKGVLFWGDIVHTAGIQFEKPEWHLVVDIDGKQGVESRKRLFAIAADKQLLIGGAHLPECGLGYVSRQGEVFFWEPLKD